MRLEADIRKGPGARGPGEFGDGHLHKNKMTGYEMKNTLKLVSLTMLLCSLLLPACGGGGGGGGGSAPTYRVTYDANGAEGGSVPVDSHSYAQGSTVTVPGNPGGLARDGYSFTGWSATAAGSGTSYTQGQTFTMGSANVTLYAKWTANPTYTVTYDGNDSTTGTAPADTTNYEAGATVTVQGNTGNLRKTGYVFAGWSANTDGSGITYAPGLTFTMGSANATLYAKWLPTSTGILDEAFGVNGKVFTDLSSGDIDGINSLAVQTDGRIVAAGTSMGTEGVMESILARYNTDGSLDESFGVDGVVRARISSINSGFQALGIQADGKIVTVGYSYTSALTNAYFTVARYEPDGEPDATFGPDHNGVVITPIGTGFDYAYAMAIQGDGKIVVAGSSTSGSDTCFALARYLPGGTLDSDFDGDGTVTTQAGPGTVDVAYAMDLQTDGKIVAAGYSNDGIDATFALVRYNADGSLDVSFDADGGAVVPGIVTTPMGSGSGREDVAKALRIQDDGRIVAAGYGGYLGDGNSRDFAVARYNADGSLDTSFNSVGIAVTDIGSGTEDVANALSIQQDGMIVAAGSAYDALTYYDFALVRYRANGLPDMGFGSSGIVTTQVRPGSFNDSAYAMIIQNDGKIVVAGWSSDVVDDDFALVRYE